MPNRWTSGATTVALVLGISLAAVACSSGDDTGAPATVTTEITGGEPSPDAGAPDDTTGEAGSDGSGAEGGSGSPAGPAYLDEATLCALVSEADVEAAIGEDVEAPAYSSFEDLGSNCIFYTVDRFELGAMIEIRDGSYAASVALYTADTGAGTPSGVECDVAGRPAVCRPGYQLDGFTYGAVRLVQIGEPTDQGLYVEALTDSGVDTLAALATTNIAPVLG